MKHIAVLACLVGISAVHVAPSKTSFLGKAHQPVNATNVLATQVVNMYTELNCQGPSTAFESSGNAFLKDFHPYIKNLGSVKVCGKGTFFYYASTDLYVLSTLGQVTRCGVGMNKTTEERLNGCECANLSPEKRKLVEGF